MSRFIWSTGMVGLVLALGGWPGIAEAQTNEAQSAGAATRASTDGAGAATTEKAAEGATTTSSASTPAASTMSAQVGAEQGSAGQNTAGQAASSQSASAPTSTSESAAQKPAASEPMDGATYQVRLRDLEQRVDELKEQIRRSHTRLSLLSDTILAGGVGGARAEIVFVNELSNAFKLIEAVFVLDGAVQYRKQDETGALAAQETIPIFSGSIPSGDHTLQVLIKLRGHGFGVFSYLRGYQFELRDSHSFTVTDGKSIEVKATAWERGGATTPLEERPAMRYTTNLRTLGEAPAPSPAGASTSGSGDASGGRASGSVSVGGGK